MALCISVLMLVFKILVTVPTEAKDCSLTMFCYKGMLALSSMKHNQNMKQLRRSSDGAKRHFLAQFTQVSSVTLMLGSDNYEHC